MANSGRDTEGSQFYLCTSTSAHLNAQHAVFGRILQGQEIVDAIEAGAVLLSVDVAGKREHSYEVQKIAITAPK